MNRILFLFITLSFILILTNCAYGQSDSLLLYSVSDTNVTEINRYNLGEKVSKYDAFDSLFCYVGNDSKINIIKINSVFDIIKKSKANKYKVNELQFNSNNIVSFSNNTNSICEYNLKTSNIYKKVILGFYIKSYHYLLLKNLYYISTTLYENADSSGIFFLFDNNYNNIKKAKHGDYDDKQISTIVKNVTDVIINMSGTVDERYLIFVNNNNQFGLFDLTENSYYKYINNVNNYVYDKSNNKIIVIAKDSTFLVSFDFANKIFVSGIRANNNQDEYSYCFLGDYIIAYDNHKLIVYKLHNNVLTEYYRENILNSRIKYVWPIQKINSLGIVVSQDY